MRLLAFDIEASGLNADFGMLLCVGFNEVGSGEEPEILAINDFKGKLYEREKKLLVAVSKRLLDCDCWLTWYGLRFDVPFLNSRLLVHHLPVLPATFPHIDGWKTSKYRLKIHSNRLASVQAFLEVPSTKTSLEGKDWILAMSGDDDALDYIINHCIQDIKVLEEAYERLKPLIINHPKVSTNPEACNHCGSVNLQKRGFHVTKVARFQRWQCLGCGAWGRDTKRVKEAA